MRGHLYDRPLSLLLEGLELFLEVDSRLKIKHSFEIKHAKKFIIVSSTNKTPQLLQTNKFFSLGKRSLKKVYANIYCLPFAFMRPASFCAFTNNICKNSAFLRRQPRNSGLRLAHYAHHLYRATTVLCCDLLLA